MSTDTAKVLKAAALKYSAETTGAPKLSAKGQGWLAEKIAEVARENNIPFHKDSDLVEILYKLELEDEIPLEVFAVVAEIFAYLYRTGQALRENPTT